MMNNTSKYMLGDKNTQTSRDDDYRNEIGSYFDQSSGTTLDKLQHFARFVPRQSLALFLAKNELFKKIVDVYGSIVECGVFFGGGVFTWSQLSAIYEPVNHNRKIIGFDTFNGFPQISNKDFLSVKTSDIDHKTQGGYCFDGLQEIEDGVRLFDINRSLGHIHKVELIKGDASQTIKSYLEEQPHIVVSLLYLDFDLYEPTVTALREFLPRMPKGAVLAFDELNQAQWPGETLAVLEEVGMQNISIRRFPYTPALSYAILGD